MAAIPYPRHGRAALCDASLTQNPQPATRNAFPVKESFRRITAWQKNPRRAPHSVMFILPSGKVREVRLSAIAAIHGADAIGIAWWSEDRCMAILDLEGGGYVMGGAHNRLKDAVKAIQTLSQRSKSNRAAIEQPSTSSPKTPEGRFIQLLRQMDWTAEFSDSARVRRESDRAWANLLSAGRDLHAAGDLFAFYAPKNAINPFPTSTGGRLHNSDSSPTPAGEVFRGRGPRMGEGDTPHNPQPETHNAGGAL